MDALQTLLREFDNSRVGANEPLEELKDTDAAVGEFIVRAESLAEGVRELLRLLGQL